MLRPSPSDLLEGVADALADTVVGELERGAVRNQVLAAIGIVRRCAAATEVHGPVLYEDVLDITESLEAMAAADPAIVQDQAAFDAVQAQSHEVMGRAYPSVTELSALLLELRGTLGAVAVEIEHGGSAQSEALVALFARILEREGRLGLSPW